MTLVIQTSAPEAFPVVEKNTFLTVYTGEVEAPQRRSSSVPARLRDRYDDLACKVEDNDKSSDSFDSEAITDVCTEASDETPASFSDSGITTEDGDISTPILEYAHQDYQDTMPLVELPPTTQKTRLNAKALSWQPAVAAVEPPPKPEPMWKVGGPQNKKTMKWWQDTAAQVVQKLSFDLGKLDYISRVESIKDGADWTVTVRSTPDKMYQFERVLTVAKQSMMKAGNSSECVYVLGKKWTPFQPTPVGFFASLGSMKTPKKACWDVYDQGVCPRGCQCLWEHPAFVTVVNVVVDFGHSEW